MKHMTTIMNNLIDTVALLWDFRVEQMRGFLKITNSGTASEFAKFGEWVDQQTSGLSARDADEFIDHYYDDLAMVRDIAPQMLHYAQILCIYGAFEHAAADIYRTLHRLTKATRKPPKNMYLHVTQKHLVDFAGFRKKAFGKDWTFLMQVREVRNAIAHGDGRLRQDNKAIAAKRFIKANKHLGLDQLDTILVERAFCKDLLGRIEKAMQLLFDEAKSK